MKEIPMTPIEIMAKANYEAESGFGSWDLVSELSQKKLCQYMRAALLALDEAELPREIEGRRLSPMDHVTFRVICRSIANGGEDVTS
jgi:hypothetical protein